MSSAAHNAVVTRQVAEFMVKRVERETGSLMLGYERVAQAVGTSKGWLRKFIRGYDVKEPGWTVGWNIIDRFNSNYHSFCDRIEKNNDGERRQLKALKEKTDAITAAFGGMDRTALPPVVGADSSAEFDQTEWP